MDNVFRQVKERASLVPLCEIYGMTLTGYGNRHKAACPFHAEKTPSFIVYQDSQTFHCFGCGAHGDAISFVQLYDGCRPIDAAQKVNTLLGLGIAFDRPLSASERQAAKSAARRRRRDTELMEQYRQWKDDYYRTLCADLRLADQWLEWRRPRKPDDLTQLYADVMRMRDYLDYIAEFFITNDEKEMLQLYKEEVVREYEKNGADRGIAGH